MAWTINIPVKLFDVPRLVTYVDVTADSVGPSAVPHGGPVSCLRAPRISILPLSGTNTSAMGVALVASSLTASTMSGFALPASAPSGGKIEFLTAPATSTTSFRIYFEFPDQA